MNGAPWWVVLASTVVGAAMGMLGSAWATRARRRGAAREEWFRRLQWAWEQTHPDRVQRTTAGMAVMDYMAESADPRDAGMILAIAPIAREVGRLSAEYSGRAVDVDFAADQVDTGHEAEGEEGDPR